MKTTKQTRDQLRDCIYESNMSEMEKEYMRWALDDADALEKLCEFERGRWERFVDELQKSAGLLKEADK